MSVKKYLNAKYTRANIFIECLLTLKTHLCLSMVYV